MTKLLGLISITVALVACKKAEPEAAKKPVETLAAVAPTVPSPVPVPPAKTVVPSTPEGAILFAGTNPTQVDALRKGQGSLVMSRGDVIAASCHDETQWAAEVVRHAQRAGDKVNCQDRVCIHYFGDDDDDRVVFAFRADGSLAGVIDNVVTGDADGAEDDIAALVAAVDAHCPETDEDMEARFSATIEAARERGELD
jgi:hypothetical protein